jgi:hypothetical protein
MNIFDPAAAAMSKNAPIYSGLPLHKPTTAAQHYLTFTLK